MLCHVAEVKYLMYLCAGIGLVAFLGLARTHLAENKRIRYTHSFTFSRSSVVVNPFTLQPLAPAEVEERRRRFCFVPVQGLLFVFLWKSETQFSVYFVPLRQGRRAKRRGWINLSPLTLPPAGGLGVLHARRNAKRGGNCREDGDYDVEDFSPGCVVVECSHSV